MQSSLWGRNGKQIKIFLAVAGAVAALAVFWFALRGIERAVTSKNHSKQEAKEEERKVTVGAKKKIKLNGKTYTYDHRIETWLFIGTDGSGDEDAQGEDYIGSMADFLLLAVVDKTDKTYGFIQINRDTITDVTMMQKDGSGLASAELQICTAHWYGGNPQQSCENTVEAVSKLLGGVTIEGYYSIGMDAMPTLNHAVGGVEVKVIGDFSKVDPTLKEGETVLLDDEQAYTYVRGRMNVGDGSNEQRMQRQDQYMKALFTKVEQTFKKNPKFLNSLYSQLDEEAVTNTKGRDVSRIISSMAGGESRGIFQFEGETTLGQRLGDGIDHIEFFPDEASVEKIMKELYHLEESDEPEEDESDEIDEEELDESEDYDESEDLDESETEDSEDTDESEDSEE